MALNAVSVSLCIDDLDARNDPKRSDRIATYKMTPEDRATIMAIIKKYKGEYTNDVGFPVQSVTVQKPLIEDAAT